MTAAELARAWAARVRLEARRPAEGQAPAEALFRQLVAEVEASTLARFAAVLDARGAVPEAEDDSVTPPAGTAIPPAASQPPAGAPPAVLTTEGV